MALPQGGAVASLLEGVVMAASEEEDQVIF